MGEKSQDSENTEAGLHASDVPPPPVSRKASSEPTYPAVPKDDLRREDGRAFDAVEEADEEELPENGSDEKLLGLLCHLLALVGCVLPLIGNVLGPLVLWLWKHNDSKLVEVEGRKSVNFQILFSAGISVFLLPILLVGGIPFLGGLVTFFCGMAIIVGVIANVVCVILATLSLNSGQAAKYPLGMDILAIIESALAKSEQGD